MTSRAYRGYTLIVDGSCCVYCAGPFQARDHYQPWSRHKLPHCLPACRDCNGLLSARTHQTFGDRCDRVISGYRKRFKKYEHVDYKKLIRESTGRLQHAFIWDFGIREEIDRKLSAAAVSKAAGGSIVLDGLHHNEAGMAVMAELSSRRPYPQVVGETLGRMTW